MTAPSAPMSRLTDAIVEVGSRLCEHGYAFTTITPASHRIVQARHEDDGAMRDLNDIFGWNLTFGPHDLPEGILEPLRNAGLLHEADGRHRAGLRFSTIGRHIYAHSPFPTTDQDAVFFGPDTYRFVQAAKRLIGSCRLLVDVGCGGGAGGIELSDRCSQVMLSDINPRALAFAEANCILNGVVRASMLHADILDGIPGEPDAIIANPPYLVDPEERVYRHGGGGYGTDLALRMALAATQRIAPDGVILLYTGSPVIRGRDVLLGRLRSGLEPGAFDLQYEEIDPDVFGDELDTPAYAEVDRIALVVALLRPTVRPQRALQRLAIHRHDRVHSSGQALRLPLLESGPATASPARRARSLS